MTQQGSAPRVDRTVLLVSMAAFASMASMRACDSMLPKLAEEFSVSVGTAAQMISAFALAYGLLQIFYGPLGDRHGKQRVIAFAAVACALTNLVIAFSPSLRWAVGWRAVAGAAAGGIIPVSLALIGDLVAYEERQAVLARLLVAVNFGLISGQWLAGVAADLVGWRAVFMALALCFAGVSWPLLATAGARPAALAPGAKGPGSYLAQLRQVLQVRWARWVLVAVGVEGVFAFSAFSFVPSFLHHEFGLSLSSAGAVMALYGVGGLMYAGSARFLIPRLGERGLVGVGAACLALALAALALCSAWTWAVPACLLGGLGIYMLHATLQTHATQMLPQLRGTAVSVFVVCLFGGQAIGVTAGASVVDWASARWVFAAGALVVPLLGLWFSLGLARRANWALQ